MNESLLVYSSLFVTDISATVKRRFIFDIRDDNDLWYRGIQTWLSSAHSFQYLFIFLSLYACNIGFFITDFSALLEVES